MVARDDAEYVEFVAAVQDGLRRTAYLLTGDWGLAADATQEALIKLYVAWPRLERGVGLAAYTRRAVVTLTIGRQRRQPRPQVAPGKPTLTVALRTLPPQQRGCVVLRCFEELTVAETADALRCTEGQVTGRTARGIGALRRELARLGLPSMAAAAMEGVA
ncbi:sigma factor-like helix-turn-helix DNA-binding protein [Nocardioides panacisoli]|uniref:SigE family RNA polymerase sigma factor n=1 Tax=Nocardioides panacisoli TaxID=627624 RepID=A0ABP7IRD5_9ACTN